MMQVLHSSGARPRTQQRIDRHGAREGAVPCKEARSSGASSELVGLVVVDDYNLINGNNINGVPKCQPGRGLTGASGARPGGAFIE